MQISANLGMVLMQGKVEYYALTLLMTENKYKLFKDTLDSLMLMHFITNKDNWVILPSATVHKNTEYMGTQTLCSI